MTLAEKLQAEGIPFVSATENGEVDCGGLPITPAQQARISEIIDEHLDPVGYAMRQRIKARFHAAKTTAKAIPNWATWTQADIQNDWNTNLSDTEADLVTSLAAARVMIKRQNIRILNLEKMVAALRDAIFPDLPE